MNSVTLYRVDPDKNMFRYYRLDIQTDLFNNECLVREWGRIGRGGQTRSIPFYTKEEAQAAFYKQQRAKERRGYAA